MRSCPGCADWIPDAARFCPSCGRSLDGGAPAPAPDPAEPAGDPGDGRRRAESRVRTLGALYIGVGAYVLLAQVVAIVMAATGATAEILRGMDLRADPKMQEALERYLELLENPLSASLPALLGIGIGAFYVWAGTRLRALRDPGAAQAAAIAMVVLSCCHSDCCACCLTIPLGIYALFVLNEAPVRAILRR